MFSGIFTARVSPLNQPRLAAAGVPYLLASSTATVTAPTDTSENTLATITIPANALGPNGFVLVDCILGGFTGTGNKQLRIKFGGAAYCSTTATTQTGMRAQVIIANINATNVQAGSPQVAAQFGVGLESTTAVDTTSAQNITLTMQKATGSDAVILRKYWAWLHYAA